MDDTEPSSTVQAAHSHREEHDKKEFTKKFQTGESRFHKRELQKLGRFRSALADGLAPVPGGQPPSSHTSRSCTPALGVTAAQRHCGPRSRYGAQAERSSAAGGHGARRCFMFQASSQPRVPGGVHAAQVVQAVGGGHQRVHFALPAFELGQVVQAGHDGRDRFLH